MKVNEAVVESEGEFSREVKVLSETEQCKIVSEQRVVYWRRKTRTYVNHFEEEDQGDMDVEECMNLNHVPSIKMADRKKSDMERVASNKSEEE